MRTGFLAIAAVAALLAAPAARPDGDPASHILLSQDVFFPYVVKIPEANRKQLSEIVADAKEKGFVIKVVLIGSDVDLGAVTSLFGKPEVYARFLGQELFFLYKGRLLTVMPNGYGVSVAGKAVEADQRVVDRLRDPGKSGLGMTSGAALAVQRLAAAHGVRVELPPLSSGSETRDRIVLALIALGVVALVGAGYFLRRTFLNRGAASE